MTDYRCTEYIHSFILILNAHKDTHTHTRTQLHSNKSFTHCFPTHITECFVMLMNIALLYVNFLQVYYYIYVCMGRVCWIARSHHQPSIFVTEVDFFCLPQTLHVMYGVQHTASPYDSNSEWSLLQLGETASYNTLEYTEYGGVYVWILYSRCECKNGLGGMSWINIYIESERMKFTKIRHIDILLGILTNFLGIVCQFPRDFHQICIPLKHTISCIFSKFRCIFVDFLGNV